jgi:crotonobetainyl-CoA:carnitine CoA-transferase CaiB-like acyl-CoA transferase
MTAAKGPMHGVRVLDLSTVVAGPMAAQVLADQGAQVIKIEAPPGGDRGRTPGSARNGMSATFHMFNRGKRSIVLDLKTAGGVAVLRRLIERADVLLHNFRPKVMGKLGLDYESLRQTYPELIYVSISGFGDVGPMADRPAYDHIVQCYTGFADLQADERAGDGRPGLIRNVVVDKLTALTAAQAVTAALFARSNGAGGQEVKLSMMGAAIAFLWPDAAVDRHLVGDGGEQRPSMASFCRLYAFKGGYITFSPTDAAFEALCRAFNAPSGADPRLKTGAGRVLEVELMAQVEQEWALAAANIDVEEGLALLEALDVPCARVVSLAELPEHPQVTANGYLRVVDHPVAGDLLEPRPAALFSVSDAAPAAPAPTLGQHAAEILAELGLDEAEQARLREEGALG